MPKRLPLLKEPEFWFIILYNIMIIVLYLAGELEPMFVVWAYYLQSLFIGIQYVIQTTIDTIRQGGVFPLKNHAMTGFFVVHYGGFHAAYLIFLFVMTTNIQDIDVIVTLFRYVGYTMAFLAVNLVVYAIREALPHTNYHKRMSFFMPYVRIVPMHLVIILGLNANSFILSAFVVFMILKLVFDLVLFLLTGREIVSPESLVKDLVEGN